MKKKTAVIFAALTAGVIIGFCTVRGVSHQVLAKGEEDFRIEGSSLTAYLGNDTFVSIPDYVTTIGKGAFAKNSTLQSIELPENLKTIEYNAFGGCTALKQVVLPETVKKVGPGAFQGCTSLSSFSIGSNVSSWGTGVFNDCTSLGRLLVEEDNLYLTYYNGALYNGNMTFLYQALPGRAGENYVMPEEVEEMDAYAFWGMKELKNVLLSENMTELPSYSMCNMGSVENVVLPQSVTDIDEKAFSDNNSLKQLRIPEETESIDKKAIVGCPNVKILTNKGSAAEKYGKDHKLPVIYEEEYPTDFVDSNEYMEEKPSLTVTVTKTETVTTSKNETQEEEAAKESANDSAYQNPLDVKEDGVIGKTIIAGGNAVVLIGQDKPTIYGTPSGKAEAKDSNEISAETEVAETKPAQKQQESEETKMIAERSFYKDSSLTAYEIGEDVEEIKRLAFARSALREITIPDGVKRLGYGAFYGCTGLEQVSIPLSVTGIETKAFADTPWLDNWLAGGNEAGDGSDFLIVGDGILLAYRGQAGKVTIPAAVKLIGSEVFKNHTELKEITIPESVVKIQAEAFRNCSALTTVNGCQGVKTIIRGAFYGTQVKEESLTGVN